MAEKKKTNLVPLNIPIERDPNSDQQVFISVNGKNYLVQRGKTVLVPPEVKEVWDRSVEAENKAVTYANANVMR